MPKKMKRLLGAFALTAVFAVPTLAADSTDIGQSNIVMRATESAVVIAQPAANAVMLADQAISSTVQTVTEAVTITAAAPWLAMVTAFSLMLALAPLAMRRRPRGFTAVPVTGSKKIKAIDTGPDMHHTWRHDGSHDDIPDAGRYGKWDDALKNLLGKKALAIAGT